MSEVIQEIAPVYNTYTKDLDGDDLLIDTNGFQVMMEWEKSYMEALIDNLNPTGDVLEIGFGFGYSATRIQQHNIKSYTVIECDPASIERAKKWAKKQPHPVTVIEGFYHIEIQKLNKKFDAVFIDDSPREIDQAARQGNMVELFSILITRMANVGCRVSWYAQVPSWFHCHPATIHSCKPFKVNIPKKCNYIGEKEKKYGTLFMPVLEYPYGSLTEEELDMYSIY
jgi:SAM-dependent methyltransferase